MTLVEFIHPLKNTSMRDICLGVLYYSQRYEQRESQTVDELRKRLTAARVKNAARANIADVLTKSAPYVHSPGKDGHRLLWALTPTGENYIRGLLKLPAADVEIEHDISSLEALVKKIKDPNIGTYLEESLKCLQIGALRATVVFLWAGAVRTVQEKLIVCDNAKLHSSLLVHDPKSRRVTRINDFAYIKEKIILLSAQDLGLYDKNQRSVLEGALDLRNKCGHPGKYNPGPKKVGGFVEDLVNIVFS